MTDNTSDLAPQNSQERDELLRSIFTRTARAIDTILRETPPEKLKASLLQSINQFLRLNDVSAGTLPDEDKETRAARELADQVRRLTAEAEEQDREDAAALARGETLTKTPTQSEPF